MPFRSLGGNGTSPYARTRSRPFRNRERISREIDVWTPGELERIIQAAGKCRNPHVLPLILLALDTGMRRGEMLSALWSDLNLDRRTLHLPITKNGDPRTVPLSSKAVDVLSDLKLKTIEGEERIFPLSPEAVKLSWKRLTVRAKLDDLHFHDLRHEAVSRFFERGLSLPEVALISGHRDPRMLLRYTHLRAEDVAAKLG